MKPGSKSGSLQEGLADFQVVRVVAGAGASLGKAAPVARYRYSQRPALRSWLHYRFGGVSDSRIAKNSGNYRR